MEVVLFDTLTPTATSGLAIDLAYLKLNRIMYRQSVQWKALKGLGPLEQQDRTVARLTASR